MFKGKTGYITMFSIDLQGTILSFSLLQITHRFKAMEVGEIMEITGIDTTTIVDLKSVLPDSGWELVCTEPMGFGTLFRLKIKKT
jgi:TusA-related sulfurtransferase